MPHEKAVEQIVIYLKTLKNKGLILDINPNPGIECFVDADFLGEYKKQKENSMRDCMSKTGYVIKYANCPIVWASKLQRMIALSTTEAEYMALSKAMREEIHLMQLMTELRKNNMDLINRKPIMKIHVYKGNVGAIELAKNSKVKTKNKAHSN